MVERDYRELIAREDVKESFTRIARHALRNIETAAFLLRDRSGAITLLQWPYFGRFRCARWEGPIPVDAIAIVHTHPNGWEEPSDRDLAEAVRSGLPIFALTHRGISVADPVTSRTIFLRRGGYDRRMSAAAAMAGSVAEAGADPE